MPTGRPSWPGRTAGADAEEHPTDRSGWRGPFSAGDTMFAAAWTAFGIGIVMVFQLSGTCVGGCSANWEGVKCDECSVHSRMGAKCNDCSANLAAA